MRKSITLCLSMLTVATFAFAQGKIEFKEPVHDFGSFKESDGIQKYRFEFKNIGDSDIVVTNVQASCGCTTPAWTREPVKPGKKGFVEAAYNPAGRPGPFNKSLSVITSSSKSPLTVLSIKGVVQEREKTIADLYPRKLQEFRLMSEYLNMGRTYPTKAITQSFKIYNDTNKTISFKPVRQNFKHIKIEVVPTTVKPKETAEIKVTYDAKLRGDWGYMNDPFDLEYSTGVDKATGKPSEQTLRMYVVATIEEEARKNLSQDELNALPRLIFDNPKKEYDFGVLRPGEIVSHEFIFRNTGGSNLLIHKTKASCGCTASDPASKNLAPKEASSIKVTFNTTGKHDGDQSQSVTIYTNDPVEPTQYITIKAKIDSKKEEASPVMANPPSIMSTAPTAAPASNKSVAKPAKNTKAESTKAPAQKKS